MSFIVVRVKCMQAAWTTQSECGFKLLQLVGNCCCHTFIVTLWMTDPYYIHIVSSTTSAVRITERSWPTSTTSVRVCKYIFADYPTTGSFWMLLTLSSVLQAFKTHCLWPVLNQRPLGLWTSLSTLWAIRPALSQCDILPLLSLSSGLLGLKMRRLAKDLGVKVRHRSANPLHP